MPRTLPSMPRSCQASLHILGSHIKNLMVHYSLGFIAYKAASGGVLSSMWDSQDLAGSMPRTPRTLRSMPRTAEDVAKHAQELPSKPTHLRFPQVKIPVQMTPKRNDELNETFILSPSFFLQEYILFLSISHTLIFVFIIITNNTGGQTHEFLKK